MKQKKFYKSFIYKKNCKIKFCSNKRSKRNDKKSNFCEFHMCFHPLCLDKRPIGEKFCIYHKCKSCSSLAVKSDTCLQCYTPK